MVAGDGLHSPGANANSGAGPERSEGGAQGRGESSNHLFDSRKRVSESGGRGRNRTADTGIFNLTWTLDKSILNQPLTALAIFRFVTSVISQCSSFRHVRLVSADSGRKCREHQLN